MLKPLTYEGRFECGLDALTRGKLCALTPVIQGSRMGLGLAMANESGYHPVPLHWCSGDNWEELQAHADALNVELFDLDKRAAASVVCSSMAAQNRKRPRYVAGDATVQP